MAPFVAMLVTIAVCPLWVPRWWEPNRNKALLAALLGVPVVLLYLARRPAALRETAAEYVSFVLLLAVLYVIAGGVHLTGDLQATPLTNTAFLAVGAGLASLALAQGLGLSPEVVGVPHRILAAISAGAVFMGANTYVGNAPNFMVKAIAEEARVPVPSFFAYMGLSGAVLLPLFVLLTWLFFV